MLQLNKGGDRKSFEPSGSDEVLYAISWQQRFCESNIAMTLLFLIVFSWLLSTLGGSRNSPEQAAVSLDQYPPRLSAGLVPPLADSAPPGVQGGRTVITTIHQPSSKMFLMFDKLLLLADGSTLYYGAASDAMAYFAQRGYTPKYATNPADYLLVRICPPPDSTDRSLSRRCFMAHCFQGFV